MRLRPEEGGYDEKTSHYLLACNLRLVIWWSKTYYFSPSNRDRKGLSLLDYIQEGNLGLIRALEKYNWRIAKFSTYATWWIRQSLRTIQQNRTAIYLPAHILEKMAKYKRVFVQYELKYSRKPSPQEVSKESGLTVEEVYLIEKVRSQRFVSISGPSSSRDETPDMEYLIPDSPKLSIEQSIDNSIIKKELQRILKLELNPKEYGIVCARFGLVDGEEFTGEEVAQKYGVSRQRINQIETKIKEKLQKNISFINLARREKYISHEKYQLILKEIEASNAVKNPFALAPVIKQQDGLISHDSEILEKLVTGDIAKNVTILVGSATGFSYDDIIRPDRTKKLVEARQVVMYFLHIDMRMSFPKIGESLGNRDHTTVMHGVQKIEERLKSDSQFCDYVEKIRNYLQTMMSAKLAAL
ncbi:MAG: RpoD subfamily polymerase sigma-70 subunit, polymerase primary sigma factor [Patescibacteria group bacterium]|nr:RpoD subfamily polymerase sigma-70 subunit, polymerase primary sigma factor [Patescibacteria group bacterium]